MKTTKNERQNARGAELAYVKGETAAAPKVPEAGPAPGPTTALPTRPTGAEVDHVRELVDRNEHTKARIFVADWMADQWDDAHAGHGFATDGNPFRIIAKALADIEAEHEKIGRIPLSLCRLRAMLTFAINGLASYEPYADAWGDFDKAL